MGMPGKNVHLPEKHLQGNKIEGIPASINP